MSFWKMDAAVLFLDCICQPSVTCSLSRQGLSGWGPAVDRPGFPVRDVTHLRIYTAKRGGVWTLGSQSAQAFLAWTRHGEQTEKPSPLLLPLRQVMGPGPSRGTSWTS